MLLLDDNYWLKLEMQIEHSYHRAGNNFILIHTLIFSLTNHDVFFDKYSRSTRLKLHKVKAEKIMVSTAKTTDAICLKFETEIDHNLN